MFESGAISTTPGSLLLLGVGLVFMFAQLLGSREKVAIQKDASYVGMAATQTEILLQTTARLGRIEEAFDKMRTDYQTQTAELTDTRRKLAESEAKVKLLEGRVAELEQDNAAMRTELEALRKQVGKA